MISRTDGARLAVSRHAARLFCEKGVDATTGDDIAAAAGVSTRTVWRYFRSKEACVEPLLLTGELGFVALLARWPKQAPIEEYLWATLGSLVETEEGRADAVAAARLVALLPKEPALRSAWLMACHAAEQDMAEIVAARANRARDDRQVRICAATIMAALRVVDEDISRAAISDGRHFEMAEVIERMATAFRAASTLPICDPIED